MKFYIDKNAEILHEDVLVNVSLYNYVKNTRDFSHGMN